MKNFRFQRNLRRFACALLALGILALGATNATWAAPSAAPGGQTVPTRTPGGAPNPTATQTPATQDDNTNDGTPQPGPTPCTVRPADPPANAPRVIREAVRRGLTLTLLNCPWSLVIEGGDIGQDGTIEAKIILASSSQGPNAGERFFGPHVELTLFDVNGNPISKPTFDQPIDLCFNYTAADLAIIGNPVAFVIELFNPDTRQWERLVTTLDPTTQRVCARLTHFSLYALAARVPMPSALPNTGGASQPIVSVWLWVALAMALGIGASIKAQRLQRTVVPLAAQKPAASAPPAEEQAAQDA